MCFTIPFHRFSPFLLAAILAFLSHGCATGGAPVSKAEKIYRKGQERLIQGNTDEALGYFRESLAAAELEGSQQGAAASLQAIAYAQIRKKEWRKALQAMNKALAADQDILKTALQQRENTQRINVLGGKVASDLYDLARLHRQLGEPEAALGRLRALLEIDLRLGRRRGSAITHNNMGRILTALDRTEEAEPHYRAALAVFEKLNDEKGVDMVRRNLSLLEEVRSRKGRTR